MGPEQTDQGGKQSHTLRNIVAAVVILLIIGGVAAYFITKNNDNSPPTSDNTQTGSQQSSAQTKTFAPAVNSNQPYSATITTNAGGTPKSATMVSDGQGNYSYTYKSNGKTVTTIYTPDAYYLCNGTATCIKYPTAQSANSGFDPSTYQYDSTKLETLKNTAAYKGQQTCPSGTGTCDVWSVSSANATSTLYVDTASKRIVKATTASGTTSSDVTYDYKSVHIAIPTNYTTIPTQ